MTIRAVFFDVGGVLVDETRIYTEWADWLGVSPLEFFGVLGAVIERREHHLTAFERIRPGFDLAAEEAARAQAGRPNEVRPEDFYPDVPACFQALKSAGYRLGIAGNQPATVEAVLKGAALPVDVVATSAGWGVEKPDPAFFARLAHEAGLPPEQIAYVGDRVDNDVLPANAAGMASVFIARGPWGRIHASWPEAGLAGCRVASLAELPEALDRLG